MALWLGILGICIKIQCFLACNILRLRLRPLCWELLAWLINDTYVSTQLGVLAKERLQLKPVAEVV